MPNFEKLTIKSAEALEAARALARSRGNPVVNDAHLLAALLDQDEGVVAPLINKEQRAVVREIVRREVGVMALSALVVVFLALRAAGTAHGF